MSCYQAKKQNTSDFMRPLQTAASLLHVANPDKDWNQTYVDCPECCNCLSMSATQELSDCQHASLSAALHIAGQLGHGFTADYTAQMHTGYQPTYKADVVMNGILLWTPALECSLSAAFPSTPCCQLDRLLKPQNATHRVANQISTHRVANQTAE